MSCNACQPPPADYLARLATLNRQVSVRINAARWVSFVRYPAGTVLTMPEGLANEWVANGWAART